MKTSKSILVLGLLAALSAGSVRATLVIDDPFNGTDLAASDGAGAINGGFGTQWNGLGSISASESGGQATVTVENTGAAQVSNGGLLSANSFDPTSMVGFTIRYDVASVSHQPTPNGMFLGLQDLGNGTFYRSDDMNFGLSFFGGTLKQSDQGFSLLYNDNNGPNAPDKVFATQEIQPASFLDGFIAEFTVTLSGWAYTITGLNDTVGDPTTFSSNGTWVGSGLASTFYADTFDNAEFISTSVQRNGDDAQTTVVFNQISLIQIPEPTTAALFILSVAGLWSLRRRLNLA